MDELEIKPIVPEVYTRDGRSEIEISVAREMAICAMLSEAERSHRKTLQLCDLYVRLREIGCSMRTLAKMAGMGKTTLYRLWPGIQHGANEWRQQEKLSQTGQLRLESLTNSSEGCPKRDSAEQAANSGRRATENRSEADVREAETSIRQNENGKITEAIAS